MDENTVLIGKFPYNSLHKSNWGLTIFTAKMRWLFNLAKVISVAAE